MPQSALDLTLTRTKTGLWNISVFESDGTTPQDLTDSTVWFHADVGGITLDKFSPDDGITIVDATAGTLQLKVDPTDTEDIPSGGNYAGPCELTMVSSDDDAFELNRGTLRIYPNVGTP